MTLHNILNSTFMPYMEKVIIITTSMMTGFGKNLINTSYDFYNFRHFRTIYDQIQSYDFSRFYVIH
jgi:hypothetical protein